MQQIYTQAPALQFTPVMQDALSFLQSILPQGAYTYCTSSIGATTGWRDQAHFSLESMVQACMLMSNSGCDAYFALSAFAQGWHTVTKADGKTINVFRTQSNAVAQRCLWLDIDCGKQDSPYPNAVSAVQALTKFLAFTKLPLPHVVASGHGVHIYWPFVETVATSQWRQMAGILKALCIHFGFVADHSRTTDPASVLRLPGTLNQDLKNKYGQGPQPVRVLVKGTPSHVLDYAGKLVKALRDNNVRPVEPTTVRSVYPVPPLRTAAAPALPAAPQGLNFDVSSFDGQKRHPYRIIKECRQIQQAGLGTYTQWYNMMLVMKHCAFGERAVHDISKMDKIRYDYNNVQTKLQQAIDGGYGPCRCDTFNEKDPGICTTCPYWGKITTPLQLGDPYNEQKTVNIQPVATGPVIGSSVVVNVNVAPTMTVVPFSNNEFSVVPSKGVVWHKRQLVTGEDVDPDEDSKHYVTKDIVISDTEIYIHSVCIDNTGKELNRRYVIRKQVPGKAAEDILFDVDDNLGSQQMPKWLAKHGMLPKHPKYNRAMSDFMNTYLAAVQNRLPEIFVRDHFGWVKNQDKISGETYDGFIVGNSMYSQRGITPVKLNDRAEQLAQDFSKRGHIEVWKHIPKMYRILNQPYPALMMCAAFGAPFMRYGVGTATNVAYSLWDIKGGKGKSTVLEAAASIWGNPEVMLQSKSDTPSSRFQKYAVYKNLPILVDEVTNLKDTDMSDLIYEIVNGREKSRSTAAGTGLAKQGTWSTITLFTSNKSLYETLRPLRAQSDATSMRVIEMQCDFHDYTGTDYQKYITTVCDAIRHNYGVAGPAFMEYCFAHPDIFERIRTDASNFVQKNIKYSDERFWMYGIAIPLAAARIAVEAGFLDYDIDGWLIPYVLNTLLPSIRTIVKQASPSGSNILSDFLGEHLNSTLVVTGAERGTGQNDVGSPSGLDTYVKNYPVNSMFIRHELDTNTYYVSTKRLSSWCSMNGISLSVMLQELKRTGEWDGSGKFQFSLGKNVLAVDRSRVMVYKFVLHK